MSEELYSFVDALKVIESSFLEKEENNVLSSIGVAHINWSNGYYLRLKRFFLPNGECDICFVDREGKVISIDNIECEFFSFKKVYRIVDLEGDLSKYKLTRGQAVEFYERVDNYSTQPYEVLMFDDDEDRPFAIFGRDNSPIANFYPEPFNKERLLELADSLAKELSIHAYMVYGEEGE